MTAKVLMVAFVARDWGQIGQTFRRKRKFCPPAHRTSEDTRTGGGGLGRKAVEAPAEGKRILRAQMARIGNRAERIRLPSIEVPEVTLGDMQNSEKFRLFAAGVAARASHHGW